MFARFSKQIAVALLAAGLAVPPASIAFAQNDPNAEFMLRGANPVLPGQGRQFYRGGRDYSDYRGGRNYGNRGGYYNGHRGYRDRRAGYRYHDGWWFPPAAFALGAIVGGAIASQPAPRRVIRVDSAHTEWCYNRYRSYRASDNTFQPYNGPRQQCYSPYS